ncbi:hypothetical protein [Mycobacterium vicinigordonae]|uniref:Outer membrane protein n=1 Tax=Mycobacterium vicinigordonae TaxID=1719132 RepID=A0A7D6IWP8_9MYCO|nr:hypothetical protein H0P51_13875 [Mycobacterium vicinigordonae]
MSSDDDTGRAALETTNASADDPSGDAAVTGPDDSTDEAPAGVDNAKNSGDSAKTKTKRAIDYSRVLVFGVIPTVALLLGGTAGYLKWQDSSMRAARISSVESLAAAKDGTIAILSYQPDTADKDLEAARDRLTGTFKDSYTQLTHDVVIPGAKQRHISAVATVPGVAGVSATANHAVALVFVNQTVVVGNDPPSSTASTVRVTLDKVRDRWLISGFDPI